VQTPAQYLGASALLGFGMSAVTILPNQVLVSRWFQSRIGLVNGIVLAATLMGVIVSEVTSNTASAALVVPVVLALSQAAGIDPVKPALAATVGCSFGFMLPVSTPPNALVYATGRVRIGEMVAAGALLDLMGVLLVSAWVTLLG